MTKYIPHIHPHQFPTAKIRTFRHTAVSHFTPILSQITAIKTMKAEASWWSRLSVLEWFVYIIIIPITPIRLPDIWTMMAYAWLSYFS